jgi:hypothetical protein
MGQRQSQNGGKAIRPRDALIIALIGAQLHPTSTSSPSSSTKVSKSTKTLMPTSGPLSSIPTTIVNIIVDYASPYGAPIMECNSCKWRVSGFRCAGYRPSTPQRIWQHNAGALPSLADNGMDVNVPILPQRRGTSHETPSVPSSSSSPSSESQSTSHPMCGELLQWDASSKQLICPASPSCGSMIWLCCTPTTGSQKCVLPSCRPEEMDDRSINDRIMKLHDHTQTIIKASPIIGMSGNSMKISNNQWALTSYYSDAARLIPGQIESEWTDYDEFEEKSSPDSQRPLPPIMSHLESTWSDRHQYEIYLRLRLELTLNRSPMVTCPKCGYTVMGPACTEHLPNHITWLPKNGSLERVGMTDCCPFPIDLSSILCVLTE